MNVKYVHKVSLITEFCYSKSIFVCLMFVFVIIRKIWIKCYICTKWYILEVLVQFRKLDWKINCDFQIIRKWITNIVQRFRKTFRIPAILRHNHHMRWQITFSKPLIIFLYTCLYLLYFLYLNYLHLVFIIIIIFIFVDFYFVVDLLTLHFCCWLLFSVIFAGWPSTFIFQQLLAASVSTPAS